MLRQYIILLEVKDDIGFSADVFTNKAQLKEFLISEDGDGMLDGESIDLLWVNGRYRDCYASYKLFRNYPVVFEEGK